MSAIGASPDPYSNYRVNHRIKTRRRIIKPDENKLITAAVNNVYLKISDKKATPPDIKRMEKFVDRVKFAKKSIKNHIEDQVQLYLLIAAATYNTPHLYYEIGHTQAQGPSSRKITVRDPVTGGNYSVRLESVHQSPLPGITFCSRKSFEDKKNGLISESDLKKYTLFHNSEYESKQNSTDPLPDFVNRADSRTQGKGNDGKLRHEIIKIINDKLSLGIITFSKGLTNFFENYERIIDETLLTLAGQPNTPKTETDKKVLAIFKKHVHYLFEKSGDYKLEDRFFGVNTQSDDPVERERKYRNCCAEMQEKFASQTILAKAISPIKNKALRRGKQKPHNYEEVVKWQILKNITDEKEKGMLVSLFLRTEEELSELTKDLVRAKTTFSSKDYAEEFAALRKKLQEQIKASEERELMDHQAKVLKSLMVKTNLEIADLVEIYNNLSRDQVDETVIKNILDKKHKITSEMANHFAAIFLSSPTCFFK